MDPNGQRKLLQDLWQQLDVLCQATAVLMATGGASRVELLTCFEDPCRVIMSQNWKPENPRFVLVFPIQMLVFDALILTHP